MTNEHPKLFISYSWSSPEHEKWVINLSTELIENGIDVIFDKFDLKEGQDANAFMERMVTDENIKKVAIICDRAYAEKADKRSGGVGTETQIISPEIYEKADQNKFVAVLAEKDENGKPYLPTYYRSRIYIDLSNDDLYASNFEQLLRWVYDKPLYVKPELGKQPSFLSEENPILLGTTSKFRRALDAVHNNRDYAKGAMGDFLSTFVANLEKFRIIDKEGEFDEKVVDNIEKFLPFRNETIGIFLAIAQYRDTPEAIEQLLRFFESLIPYMDRPENVTSWSDSDFDNFRFIIHELFLYAVACLLKYECFNSLSYLLRQNYYVEGNSDYGKNVMVPFDVFQQYIRSLDNRNKRLELRKLSLQAHLLEQRSKTSGMTFRQLMQADFVLFIRDSFDSIRNKRHQRWAPITLVYAETFAGPFEIFARAQSKEYFEKLKCLFDIHQKTDFSLLFDAFKDGRLQVPRWQFRTFDPDILIGFEKLATIL